MGHWQFHRSSCILLLLLMLQLQLQSLTCFAKGDLDIINSDYDVQRHSYSSLRHSNDFHLRGHSNSNSLKDEQFGDIPSSRGRDMKQQQNLQSLAEELQQRSVEANIPTIFVTPSSIFQIIVSILLAILILLQLFVFLSFLRNRSKRVLEFSQPAAICIFVACSIIATASCYLYVYVSSSLTCAIREPLLFMSVSLMGATVGGRAWRISTLVNNPVLTAGKNSNTVTSSMEQARQLTLRMLSVLSGYNCSAVLRACRRRRVPNMSSSEEDGRRSRPIRVQVTFAQMMRVTFFMVLPQLFWQIIVISTPTLRSYQEIFSNTYLYNGAQMMTMEQYQCQSSVGLWPHCVSVFLALCPYAIAYTLNVRPKSELHLLPNMIDERAQLHQSFCIFARVIAVSAPVIGLTYSNNPEAKVYSVICAVLALPLACCYYIAYLKLNAIKSDVPMHQARRTSIVHSRFSRGKVIRKRSPTSVLRMAEMYVRIGRPTETIQLVNDEMNTFRKNKSTSGGNPDSPDFEIEGKHLTGNRGNVEVNQEVALGFTEMDLKHLNEDELELIIRLIKLKGRAFEKLEGQAGHSKVLRLNIGKFK